jgi:hypothetical protein
MYSTAFPRTVALLPFLATLTPSTKPFSSTTSKGLFDFSSNTLRAGTACLRLWILAFKFVRYLRSIVVWLVFGRPIMEVVGAGLATSTPSGPGEEVAEDEGIDLVGARFCRTGLGWSEKRLTGNWGSAAGYTRLENLVTSRHECTNYGRRSALGHQKRQP